MAWEIEFTDQFGEWWAGLSEREQDAIRATVEILEERGPGLGRPHVDTVKGSRRANMKELRPHGGNIRIPSPLIRVAWPFSLSEGTRRIAGMDGTER